MDMSPEGRSPVPRRELEEQEEVSVSLFLQGLFVMATYVTAGIFALCGLSIVGAVMSAVGMGVSIYSLVDAWVWNKES